MSSSNHMPSGVHLAGHRQMHFSARSSYRKWLQTQLSVEPSQLTFPTAPIPQPLTPTTCTAGPRRSLSTTRFPLVLVISIMSCTSRFFLCLILRQCSRGSRWEGDEGEDEEPQPPTDRQALVSECKDMERQIKAVYAACESSARPVVAGSLKFLLLCTAPQSCAPFPQEGGQKTILSFLSLFWTAGGHRR